MSLDYTGLGELIDVLANEIRTLREQNQRMEITIQSLRVALAEIELILRGAGAGK